jgi:hypothetical protein
MADIDSWYDGLNDDEKQEIIDEMRETATYNDWLDIAEELYGESARDYDSDFNELVIKAYGEEWDRDADGYLADLLEYIELRDEDSPYDVGDTGEVAS